MSGVAALAEELEALGYEVQIVRSFAILDYEVDIGPLDGTIIKLALDGSGHPHSPPSGPYVSPWLLPLRPDGSPAPLGGVHDARQRDFPTEIAGEWQYWSRPFNEWTAQGRSAKAYLDVHLRRLFAQLPAEAIRSCAA
jgi:hypothetical protein